MADYVSQQHLSNDGKSLMMADVLDAMIKAYEIQGILALENSFNRVGLDHVLLVRVASTAVVTAMLGRDRNQIFNALSHAWIDGAALRTYRHAPNTGSRKSWASGDAVSRAVWLSLLPLKKEIMYPSALTAETWGFQDVMFNSEAIKVNHAYGTYVMENILFKISYPAEFHAQTAVEAAIKLSKEVKDRLDEIEKIVIETQEAGMRIIDKTGPLYNPADRDHCIQYIVAIPLIFGRLTADDYEDGIASDPRIDSLREKMEVLENKRFSVDYLDPDKRAIGNAVQIFFNNGEFTERIEIEYPLGHRLRRSEGLPLLKDKFKHNLESQFDSKQIKKITEIFNDQHRFEKIPVNQFIGLFSNT